VSDDSVITPPADDVLTPVVPAQWASNPASAPWCPPVLASVLARASCEAWAQEPRVVRMEHAGWQVQGASVRGRAHAHRSEHRDDALACASRDGTLVLAVADGAGSSALSRIGAAVVAERAVQRTLDRMMPFKVSDPLKEMMVFKNSDPLNDSLNVTRLGTAMAHAVHDAATELYALAEASAEPPSAFRTTLLLAAIHGDILLLSQVGDGAALVEKTDGTVLKIGSARESAWAGEVHCFVPDPCAMTAAAELRQLRASDVRTLALLTDGVDDPFHPLEQTGHALMQQWRSGTTSAIGTAKQPEAPAVLGDADALLTWLQFEQRGEVDDRTLLLAWRTTA
jgi:hypothetical protein